MSISTAGILASALLMGVAIFQAALARGAPYGHMAYGGRLVTEPGPLPRRMRRISAANAGALTIMALLSLEASGWIQVGVPPAAERVLLWIVCGFMGLNTLANLAARHPAERFGMGAVSLTLAGLMGHLALNLG